jgi:hypothetical protein
MMFSVRLIFTVSVAAFKQTLFKNDLQCFHLFVKFDNVDILHWWIPFNFKGLCSSAAFHKKERKIL